MTFQNYNTKNDAISTLLAGISASATSVQVQSADGVKFPTGNFVATIIQYTNKLDRTSAIVKKEKVLVSTNATDTFTITRGFGGDAPTAFETGDTIVLNVVSEVIEDIQDEVARLESDKLNKGGLRTALTNTWKMFFSNGSNNETELAFGSFGRVLQSNGATSAPTWEVPTVDINSLTEDTSGNLANDFFVKNNGTGANTKIKLTRYKASDAEVKEGTQDTKYITSKQAKDHYGFGLTFNTYIATNAPTSSKEVVGVGFVVLTAEIGTGNSPTNVSIVIQTSTDNVNWTDRISQAITYSNQANHASISMVVNDGIYVRGNQSGNTGDTVVMKLTVQDNS